MNRQRLRPLCLAGLSALPASIVLVVLVCLSCVTAAQSQSFDLDRYREFLKSTTEIGYDGLSTLYPRGAYEVSAETNYEDALFSDLVAERFSLTPYEESLIRQHGFVVTERFQSTSFGDAFWQIYVSDLPVYVSADALLQAVHMSYRNVLKDIERNRLIPQLGALVDGMRKALPDLALRLDGSASIDSAVVDLDVYLTVAKSLLDSGQSQPIWASSQSVTDGILDLIIAEQPATTRLFSESCRLYDFSQFKPRGHYTESEALRGYFQAMMWLGRTELYLVAPETGECRPSRADVRRQTLMALLVKDLLDEAGMRELYDGIENVIAALVGEQDNTTIDVLEEVATAAAIVDPRDFLDPARETAFYATLAASPFVRQRINSQILLGSVTNPDAIRPSGAFLLFGQRFLVDSYVTGHVVFAEVPPRPTPRMLPNTGDVLFALGNDAALPLLENELNRFNYGPQLGALRYLIDGYDEAYWEETFYNGWLSAIRALNPPEDRAHLPRFMQTGAWWQKEMTTQLAGWAQLRHDNLLYGKQSYSGGLTCVYPHALVEPIPEFFGALSRLAARTRGRFEALGIEQGIDFLREMETTTATLERIAQQQLDGLPLNSEDHAFFQSMINEGGGSGPVFDGWYPRLFYPHRDNVLVEDRVVADIHTAPTDASGAPVGWVVHAGTGPVNLAIITTEVPDVGPVTFAGPVLSYYEHVSTNFRRLTDEEWETEYAMAPSFRPDLVNLYLANSEGESRGSGFRLVTDVESPPGEEPRQFALSVRNYPNPFSGTTTITFRVPPAKSSADVRLEIFDANGRRLVNTTMRSSPEGNYAWRWDARRDVKHSVSGVYFCRITVDGETRTAPMVLLR
jgi:uncharacterized protein DUF3160